VSVDLIKIDELKVFGKLDSNEYDDQLTVLIAAISEQIRHWTLFDWDQNTYSEIRNGNGQLAMQALKAGRPGPPITGTPTVAEDGVNLVVAIGYSTTADVVADLDRGIFYRRPGTTTTTGRSLLPGRWSPGVQNLVFGYQTGYTQDQIPGDIKLVAKYASLMVWKQSDKKQIGISSRGTDKGSVGFLEDLPDLYKQMLNARRRMIAAAA